MKSYSIRTLLTFTSLVAFGLFVWLPATISVRVDDEFVYGFCNVTAGQEIFAVSTDSGGDRVWIPGSFVDFSETNQMATLQVSRFNSFRISGSAIYDFSFDPENKLGCIWHFPDVVEN